MKPKFEKSQEYFRRWRKENENEDFVRRFWQIERFAGAHSFILEAWKTESKKPHSLSNYVIVQIWDDSVLGFDVFRCECFLRLAIQSD